ncbi:hypothetical protein NA78x_001546 [Anatilimnocola sp. NA78]|uniref:hypothetical protein n=1 Tax=Anatilimnocola sp. NA78 TaxID=3415683 RepID=UPI003CE5B8BC
MHSAPHQPWQFTIRALLGVMTLAALLLAGYRFFGWPVLMLILHPAAIFVYVGIFIEWRSSGRLTAAEQVEPARKA